jgi:outer membrane lipoprotein-sorting protein
MTLPNIKQSAIVLLAVSWLGGLAAWAISPEQVLQNIDRQLYISSTRQEATMEIVYGPDDVRVAEMVVYSHGTDTARITVLSPPRDKDSEFLRRGKSLWIYFPRNQRTLLIQGHRLREGMMGSDFSYEDMTESSTLLEDYTAEFLAPSDDGNLRLLLTAKVPDATYYQRRVTVDTLHWVPTRIELISKSGKVLKEVVLDQVKRVDGHWMPHRTVMRDLLRQDTRTTFVITKMEIGVQHPDGFFTRRALGTK